MAQGGLRHAAIVSLLAIGACAAPAAKPPPPAAPAPAPAPPPATVEPAPPPQVRAAPPPHRDQCGADPLQYLVGKPRAQIPVPLQPNRRRVVCTTCPVAQDYVPYRQTITYDSSTGLVTSVKCG